MKIVTLAEVPPELAHTWLQHLRDFDAKNPGCHFEVLADAPEMPFAEMVHMLTVNPSLSVFDVVKRVKAMNTVGLRERVAISPDFDPEERNMILDALNAMSRTE